MKAEYTAGMKERIDIDRLRLATPYIRGQFANATIREVKDNFASYPLPAISPRFRIASDATDLQAVDTSGWQRRFLVHHRPIDSVQYISYVEPSTRIGEIDSTYVLSELPFDALSLQFIHLSHKMSGDSQQAATSIKYILSIFLKTNPHIEKRMQEHYRTNNLRL